MIDAKNVMSEYYKGVDKFRSEIRGLPNTVEKSSPHIDFSSDLNYHQSIMIDVQGVTEALADQFFLFAEEVEENIIKPLIEQLSEAKSGQ